MFQRKECKKIARKTFRKHYILFVFLCLVSAMTGAMHSSSYTELTEEVKVLTSDGKENTENVNSKWRIYEAISNSLDNKNDSKKIAQELLKKDKDEKAKQFGHLQIGYDNGVFAKVRDELLSGAFIITALSALTKVLGSSSMAVFVFVIVAFALVFSVWIFFVNVFRVIYSRMFLEGRIYKRVPIQRFTYLLYVKKWKQASLTMLVESIYYNLWCLTVIGGMIKFYSYFAVPYIVAENPDMKSKDVINLSRRMMDGHKWECFKVYLSFFGWEILDVLTFGITGILYSNPYMEAVLCEYYVYLRSQAKEKNLDGIDALNDTYLYELPSKEILTEYYGSEEIYGLVENLEQEKSFTQKAGDFFGVYLSEEKYKKDKAALVRKNKYERVKYVLSREEYGQKLLPIPDIKRRKSMNDLYFDRKYSIWTLILFFVFFSFCGWAWEVSLRLVQTGQLVNRGILQGPYLPIYGTGGVLILLILKKLRNNPSVEFASAILLCGFVEYLGGYMMEKLHHGEKWWNYSGYFLNIDGRVCAEGLLVFGLGGVIVVYFIAPMFDNFVRKYSPRTVMIASVVLITVMGTDMIYSSFHPNTGAGVTIGCDKEHPRQIECLQARR